MRYAELASLLGVLSRTSNALSIPEPTLLNAGNRSMDDLAQTAQYSLGAVVPPLFTYTGPQIAGPPLNAVSFLLDVVSAMGEIGVKDFEAPFGHDPGATSRRYVYPRYPQVTIEIKDERGRMENRFALWALWVALLLNSCSHGPTFRATTMNLFWAGGPRGKQKVGSLSIRRTLRASLVSELSSSPSSNDTQDEPQSLPMNTNRHYVSNLQTALRLWKSSDVPLSNVQFFLPAARALIGSAVHPENENLTTGEVFDVPEVDSSFWYRPVRSDPPRFTHGSIVDMVPLIGETVIVANRNTESKLDVSALLDGAEYPMLTGLFKKGRQ